MPNTETSQNTDETEDKAIVDMQEQLRKDAASWAKERASSSALRQGGDLPIAVANKPPTRVRKSAAAAVAVAPAKPVTAVKKPFGMSYDGVTTAEHITDMINRGRR